MDVLGAWMYWITGGRNQPVFGFTGSLRFAAVDLVLQLPDALRQHANFGVAQRIAGELYARRRERVRALREDARDLDTFGRREIADVHPARFIGPRVDVRVRERQRACTKQCAGQYRRQMRLGTRGFSMADLQ